MSTNGYRYAVKGHGVVISKSPPRHRHELPVAPVAPVTVCVFGFVF